MTRTSRVLIRTAGALAAALVMPAAPSYAVVPKDRATPLEQKEFFRPELTISSSNVPLSDALDRLPNRAAWESFLALHAGSHPPSAFIDPRSGAATNIIGLFPLLPGDGASNRLTPADVSRRLGRAVTAVDDRAVADLVSQFVRTHADLLGVDVAQLGPARAARANDDLWHVTIPQVVKGVPVRYGHLVAAISHGNLVVIGTEVWGNVHIDTAPRIGAEQAVDAGFDFAGGRTVDDLMVGKPQLEVVPFAPPEFQKGEAFAGPIGSGYGHRLVWTFAFQRPPEMARWEVMVDANTGEVIAFEDKNQYVAKRILGGVFPLTNTEVCPTPQTCGTMQPGTPMPFADTGFGAPNNFANSAGLYNYTSGTATSALNGQFVRINDNCGAISLSSTNGTLDFGGSPTDHDCVTPGFGGAGNTSASRSCFFETNKIKEQARGWLPANAWLQGQLTANVNIPITCNAFWDGTTVNFYRSGGGCRNTGEIAAVFDHEWGHGMDDNDTGGGLSNSSEGYADIAAIYRLQASCVGHGFFQTIDDGCGMTADGTGFNANEDQNGGSHCDTDCSGVRDSDFAKHVPNTPDTPTGFVCTSCLTGSGPCGRQVHCAAAPSRQAAWDLVARDLPGPPFNMDSQSSFLLGNKLFYQGSGLIGAWHSCTCGGSSDGCGATNGYMQWLTADDDNGNLADGTPHMTALFAAFNRHNIACATPAPTNSGCAAGPSASPTVTATPGNNQVQLTWTAVAGATRYWVFRGEGYAGCNFGKALIAEVTTLTYTDTQVVNGRPYAYNVVAAGASSACFSRAGTCLMATPVPAAGPTNLVATATAPNVIGLTWTAEPTAASYKVYRAVGACPQPNYTLLASNVATNSFNDTTVSGGTTYSYVVTFLDGAGSESGFSNCDDATATGQCTLPPVFAGVTSVSTPGTSSCALDVAWAAATPSCPSTTVKYNVYRSTTPGFTPNAASLRQSCVDALTFQDANVTSGTRYYYVVRAEDSTANGSGLCNNGNEDTNLTERSGVPRGPSATVTDDVENGGDFWTNAGGSGTNLWGIVTTASHSPTHAWFVADPAVVTDQRLATVAAGNIPAAFVMSFWIRYNTEAPANPPTGYDGAVLEYSLDGGTTWTDILAAQGPVPANANRILQTPYTRTISTGFSSPLAGRLAWSGDNLAFEQVRVDMADFATRDVQVRIRFASDSSVADTGVWIDDITYRFPGSCTTGPAQSAAPVALSVDAAGNRVLQVGETAAVAPTWRNTGAGALALTGAATNFTGPAGPTYTITDASASYGTIPASGEQICTDCYAVSIAGARPTAHWDATITETVTPTSTVKDWTLHVGDSFTDVLAANPFYRFVETLFHKGVTGGCATAQYCPSTATTREQMAAFVLVSKEGAGYNPPACAPPNLFNDVPETSAFCKFIEELANRGVVSGCNTNPPLYCPQSPVTREQMAIFVLRTLDPTLNPPACGTPVFTDVPASSPFCRWIEELARRGVVTGCSTNPPQYCPTQSVTREQMAVFLSVTFGLQLYGL